MSASACLTVSPRALPGFLRRQIYRHAFEALAGARRHLAEAKAFERAAAKLTETAPDRAADCRLRAACAYAVVVYDLDWAIYWRGFARMDRAYCQGREALLAKRLS